MEPTLNWIETRLKCCYIKSHLQSKYFFVESDFLTINREAKSPTGSEYTFDEIDVHADDKLNMIPNIFSAL